MSERTFACAEFCSSNERGPDLGPSTKPCDCWNAEIRLLKAKAAFAQDQLTRSHRSLDRSEKRREYLVERLATVEAIVAQLEPKARKCDAAMAVLRVLNHLPRIKVEIEKIEAIQ